MPCIYALYLCLTSVPHIYALYLCLISALRRAKGWQIIMTTWTIILRNHDDKHSVVITIIWWYLSKIRTRDLQSIPAAKGLSFALDRATAVCSWPILRPLTVCVYRFVRCVVVSECIMCIHTMRIYMHAVCSWPVLRPLTVCVYRFVCCVRMYNAYTHYVYIHARCLFVAHELYLWTDLFDVCMGV